MTHWWIWHKSFIYLYAHCLCFATHLWIMHLFVNSWRIHTCGMTQWKIWYYSFTDLGAHFVWSATHLQNCAPFSQLMAHPYMRHDSFIYVNIYAAWLIQIFLYTCGMTHSYISIYMRHDSFIYVYIHVAWLIHIFLYTCGMTYSYMSIYMRHDSFIYVSQKCAARLIHIVLYTCGMTHTYMSMYMQHDSFIHVYIHTCLKTHSCL